MCFRWVGADVCYRLSSHGKLDGKPFKSVDVKGDGQEPLPSLMDELAQAGNEERPTSSPTLLKDSWRSESEV